MVKFTVPMPRGAWKMKASRATPLAAFLIISGCALPPPGGAVSLDSDATRARDAFIRSARAEAKTAHDLGEQLAAGKSVDAGRWMTEAKKTNEDARREAFAPINRAMNAASKSGKFDPEAKDLFFSIAEGYASVGDGGGGGDVWQFQPWHYLVAAVFALFHLFNFALLVWLGGTAVYAWRTGNRYLLAWPIKALQALLAPDPRASAPDPGAK
jgi:hypothetical protein